MSGGDKIPELKFTKYASSLELPQDEFKQTSKTLFGDFGARLSFQQQLIGDLTRRYAYTGVAEQIFKGRTVLHLRSSLGIYSLRLAHSGAKFVLGVDKSAIVDRSIELAEANEINNIAFLRGSLLPASKLKSVCKVETVLEKAKDIMQARQLGSFDFLVCEWMTSLLLTDWQLVRELVFSFDSLVKNDWTSPNSQVCPNVAFLTVVGVSDYTCWNQTLEFWDNVYGFAMPSMKQRVMQEPVASCILPKSIVTNETTICHLSFEELRNLVHTSEKEGSYPVITDTFDLHPTAKTVLYFLTFLTNASYTIGEGETDLFHLFAYPGNQMNPWPDVSIMLKDPLPVEEGDVIHCTVRLRPSQKIRAEALSGVHIELDLSCSNINGEHHQSLRQFFLY